MLTLYAEKKEVLENYSDIISKWYQFAESVGRKIENDIYFYSYGYFIPKFESIEDREAMYSDMMEMNYSDRLKFELSKIRVNLFLKVGNFSISDRMPPGIIPDSIRSVVSEVTKIKMLAEFSFHNNEDIKNSIPELDPTLTKFLNFDMDNFGEEEVEYDIDHILDKISKEGIESLTEGERDFLNEKSKNL